jgi:hypothetical protein
MMKRVRIIKKNQLGSFFYEVGGIYFLPDFIAREWIKKGYAIEDRTIDVPEVR